MKKEKFHIEYVFDKVSKHSLWNHVTTPPGLSSWFADAVEIEGDTYTFIWDRTRETALVLDEKPETSMRFRWEGEEESYYFEFHIYFVELTGAVLLEITDFAEHSEKADAISLWDSQVEQLKRTLGAY
jgi:hypothetical protein